MKILMVTMALDIGGAETHIVELAGELVRMGHQVTVVSNGGVYVPALEAAGVRHLEAPLHRRNPLLMAKSYASLRKIIRQERPDVVHAHARIPAFVCGLLKKRLDFPFVTTAHWVFKSGFLLRRLTDWGDYTIAVSDDIREYLTDNYGVDRNNITVTINGIDTGKFSPEVSGEAVREEFGIPAGDPVVAHVSRLDEDRALAAATLIEIAPALAKRVPRVRLLIAGGGDSFTELTRRAEEANLRIGYRCVILAGPRTDVNTFCAAGDVFVGVSRAALEAMATAKPVVVAGNEGYMGLFDEDRLQAGIDTNFCCRGLPAIDRRVLLDDVTTALTLEPDEHRRLSAYGRQVVAERYSLERMARDALAVYEKAQPPRSVVLSGYYGFGNMGDEAILEALCGAIHAIDSAIEVTVLSRDPAFTEAAHPCQAVRRFSPVSVYRAVKKCELLISGGGSLLQDNTSTRSLIYYLSVIRLAHRLGKKTMLFANGIGPVTRPANRRRVRDTVELVDCVTLRDPDSLGELRAMGVTRPDLVESGDAVFTLPAPSHRRAQEILDENGVEGPFVTVAVRPIKNAPGYLERIAALCDGVHDRYGLQVLFIAMQPRVDEPVSWDIRELMHSDAVILRGDYTPTDIMAVIGEGRIALSMRLHSLIFAACTATPTLGFDYDPKVASYLAMLDMPEIRSVAEMDVAEALDKVDMLLRRRDEMSRTLRQRREEIRERALLTNRELEKLLAVGEERAN